MGMGSEELQLQLQLHGGGRAEGASHTFVCVRAGHLPTMRTIAGPC